MSKVGDVARFALEVSGHKVEAQELTTADIRTIEKQMDAIAQQAKHNPKADLSGFEQRVMADGMMRNRRTRRAIAAYAKKQAKR